MVSTLSAAQFQTAPLGAGVRNLEPEPDPDPNPNIVIVDAGEVWQGLLARAAMVAPHLQLAVIEGEPGVGKATLARYLHSRAAIHGETFQRHDAREWLTKPAHPPASNGFVYLDRIDLLGPAEQALLLGRLKSMQDRTLRHHCAGRILRSLPASDGHERKAAVRPRLPADRRAAFPFRRFASAETKSFPWPSPCSIVFALDTIFGPSRWVQRFRRSCSNTTGPATSGNYPALLKVHCSTQPME